MTDIDPATVMAAHEPDRFGCCSVCVGIDEDSDYSQNVLWPCEPYRLAEALAVSVEQAEARGIEAAMARDAVDELNGDLAASEAKVARVEALRPERVVDITRHSEEMVAWWRVTAALADQPKQAS